MLMCAIDVRSGHNTVGDFVMVNAMMIQLYQPLNFMGMVYREIKQAIIDIEKMFEVLRAQSRGQGYARREAARRDVGQRALRGRALFLRSGASDPRRA